MATKYLVQHRRGTAAQWAEQDTLIPREGEIVIEIDEVNSLHKLKIGDGIHTYDELAYLQAGDEIVTQVLAEVKPRVVTVSLAETWNSDVEGKYSQVLTLDGITKNSRLDLQPSADMLAEFKQLGLVFVTENKGGTITVYSVGNMPLKSYTMQATIVETECDAQDTGVVGIPVGTPVAQSDWAQTDETKADFIKNKPKNPQFGANVQIIGGENETDTSRVEVNRKLENYSASSRKFAAYDYNSFFTTDKLVDGKPLRVCTNVWTELQLDAYSNQNVASDLIVEDYNANADKYYDDGDSIRRNINIHYPLKDGQVAIIERGGILRAYNFEGDNVNTGALNTGWVIFGNDGGTQATYNRLYSEWWKLNKLTSIEAPQAEATFKKVIAGETRTDWLIFKNDEATMGAPNRMFNDSWQLSKVSEIKAAAADTWFKNVHSQAFYAPWLVFDNDGGTAETYNRLYNEWWKLNKLKTIEAPHATVEFFQVKAPAADFTNLDAVDLDVTNLDATNVHAYMVVPDIIRFDNDGYTEESYNRMRGDGWYLTKLQKISAPIADASFKSVKVEEVVQSQKPLKIKTGDETFYPQMIKKCTRTTRPTEAIAGELWYEEDTGRTIRRNKDNNGWIDMMGNPIVACPMYFDFQTVVDSAAYGSAMYALTVNGETVHLTPPSGASSYQHDFEDVWSATLTMYDFSGASEDMLPLVEGQRVFSTDDYVMHPGATIDLLSAFKRGGAIHITNKVPN